MSWEVSDLDVSLLDTMTKLEIQLEIYDVILIGYFVPIISENENMGSCNWEQKVLSGQIWFGLKIKKLFTLSSFGCGYPRLFFK